MRAVALVPARLGSTRLPRKVLADIGGQPMVIRVARRLAAAQRLDAVAIATDSDEIAQIAQQAGVPVVRTRSDHTSGTDRVAEAARAFDAPLIINVQGDEPLIDPALVDALVDALRAGASIVTAAAPLIGDPADPARVKVVADAQGRALYFSRAAIPSGGPFLQHLGVYGFTRAALLQVTALPPSPLEGSERLEQLRWIEGGHAIQLVFTPQSSPAVDTAEDLARVRAMLGAPQRP